MLMLTLICLAVLSLSTSELKTARIIKHQDIAESNARLALGLAIGELQQHTGGDQCVTANAAILETDELLANRSWLGVWSTTYEAGHKKWPLIGKEEKALRMVGALSCEDSKPDHHSNLPTAEDAKAFRDQPGAAADAGGTGAVAAGGTEAGARTVARGTAAGARTGGTSGTVG